MNKQEKRIKAIRKRINDANEGFLLWNHIRYATTDKEIARKAVTKMEMYSDRRDLWEERLVLAELA